MFLFFLIDFKLKYYNNKLRLIYKINIICLFCSKPYTGKNFNSWLISFSICRGCEKLTTPRFDIV